MNGQGPGAAKVPVGCRGNALLGGTEGQSPPAENEFGYFGDQFAASQCTEIVKTIFFFFFALKLKHQNQHFSTFSVTPSNFFKTTNIKSDSQDHKIYQSPLEHFKIYVCMSHDLPDYQS